jgi:predicted HicB family RNase H-like nuclease
MKTKRFELRLEPQTKELWQQAAEEAGVSLSELIETLMNRHLGISGK